jgi:polyhydroxyalkanoate synthesis regulator phasin
MSKADLSDIPYLLVGAAVAVQEEIEKAADRLVDKGKSLTPEGRKKAMGEKRGLVSKGDDFSQVVARTVQRVLENTGIVTRDDLRELDEKVSEIEKKVAGAKKDVKPVKEPAKKKAAKKPAKKKAAKKPAKKTGSKKSSAGKKKKPAQKKYAEPAGKPEGGEPADVAVKEAEISTPPLKETS